MARLSAFLMAATVVMVAAAPSSKKDGSHVKTKLMPLSTYSTYLQEIKSIVANSWFSLVRAIKPVVVLMVINTKSDSKFSALFSDLYSSVIGDSEGSLYVVTWTEGIFGKDVVPFLTFEYPPLKKGDEGYANDARTRALIKNGKYEEAQKEYYEISKDVEKKMKDVPGLNKISNILGHN